MLDNIFGRKKAQTYYDTEAFKNKVRMDELQEKLARQNERQKIAEMQKKLRPSGLAGGVGGFLESMYGQGGMLHGMYGKPQARTQPKRRVHHRAKPKVRTRVVYVQAPPRNRYW